MDEYVNVKKEVGNQNCTQLFWFYIVIIIIIIIVVILDYHYDGITYVELHRKKELKKSLIDRLVKTFPEYGRTF